MTSSAVLPSRGRAALALQCEVYASGGYLQSFAEARLQQLERLAREGPHVRFAPGAAGFDGNHCFDRTGDGDAGMAGRVAVAVAGGTARAGFAQGPGGA